MSPRERATAQVLAAYRRLRGPANSPVEVLHNLRDQYAVQVATTAVKGEQPTEVQLLLFEIAQEYLQSTLGRPLYWEGVTGNQFSWAGRRMVAKIGQHPWRGK